MKFNQMLECFGLSQHVAGPTHKAGHTLDVFITKTDQMLSFDASVYPIQFNSIQALSTPLTCMASGALQ